MKYNDVPNNFLRREIDEELAFLDSRPSLHDSIMKKIKGENVVMKKKLSFGFALIFALLLIGTVALAATLLWQDYVPQMKELEREMGDYAQWPDARRIRLVSDIVDMGYMEPSDLTAVLTSNTATEAEKAAAADQLILDLIGQTEAKEVHSNLITYAILGHEDTWTPEQRVWWHSVLYAHGDDGAPDTLLIPTAQDISEDAAISIAREALQDAYGFDDSVMNRLHPVANLYVTDQRPDYKRWDIQFKQYREGSSTYVEKIYCVIVDENGQVIGDEDVGVPHIEESAARARARQEKPAYVLKFLEYQEYMGNSMPFWHWSYQAKAACYAAVYPMVANLESLNEEIADATFYAYGLPEEDDIPYETALAMARQVLKDAYGMSDDQSAAYSKLYEAFDVTNPEQSLWKFVFINPDDYYGLRYRVLLDAATGEVVLHESFPWMQTHQDEEMDRKYY